MMYPNLTEEEDYVVRDFVKKIDESGGYEPLDSNKDSPNYIPDAVFLIYHMRSVGPDHPNHRLKQYNRAISKMKPNDAKLLENILREFEEYRLTRRDLLGARHGRKLEDRKPKKPVKKVTRCKCKK